jgi:hypothetical protein
MSSRPIRVRDFPGKRWLNVGLRTAHLAGVVLLGAAVLGGGDPTLSAVLTFVSGALMFAVDSWANPTQLRELAGLGIIAKLVLIGLAAWQSAWALPLFWLILVLSSILSHAPSWFRHLRLL